MKRGDGTMTGTIEKSPFSRYQKESMSQKGDREKVATIRTQKGK
jgi:hypothetical protein